MPFGTKRTARNEYNAKSNVKTQYYKHKGNKKIDIGTTGKDGKNNATGNQKLDKYVKE